jgi:hypothetical protein
MAKPRTSLLAYRCALCPEEAKPVQAPQDSALGLLRLCQAHHDARIATGMQAQRDHDAKEAARAR